MFKQRNLTESSADGEHVPAEAGGPDPAPVVPGGDLLDRLQRAAIQQQRVGLAPYRVHAAILHDNDTYLY